MDLSSNQIDPRRVVCLGGGTGLSALLRGLKRHVGGEISDLKAIVTMSDDGGSSGRLRRELGVLPPGDIRNCLVAVADEEDCLARLFQYRFATGEGLSGHSFGNLFLTALTDITGDFSQAVLMAESILSVRGRILPATLADVRLEAVGATGRRYRGESAIGASAEPLAELALHPAEAPAFGPAIESIRQADLIAVGPGSLYTSILPNLLLTEIQDAVRASVAPVVLVLNLMTQPGETDGMSALDHLRAIERHAGAGLVDTVLFNTTEIPEPYLEPYRAEGSTVVTVDEAALGARGARPLGRDLLASGPLIRHDSDKLGAVFAGLLERRAHQASPALEARR